MARVVPAPPPISEDTIADSLWKFAAIEHLVLGFKQQESLICSCTAPMGCVESLQAVLSQDEQMDFADLSDLGVGDVSASGICFVLPRFLLLARTTRAHVARKCVTPIASSFCC